MTADERLAFIRTKVERAKQHLGDLEIARNRFIDSEPYVIRTKRDPKTGYDVLYLTDIQTAPAEIGIIAGDAIHNLRSALDHLAYQLVLVNGNAPNTQTCFPIFDTAQHVTSASRQVKGMRQTAIDAINTTKPYQGGTDELWWLHKLDIADKHHAMLFALFRLGEATIQIPGWWERPRKPVRGFAFPTPFGTALKDGDELFTCEPGVQQGTKFIFDVTLAEPQIVKDFPLLKLLEKIFDVVDGLIVRFRSELT